jgi:hypothetical protein
MCRSRSLVEIPSAGFCTKIIIIYCPSGRYQKTLLLNLYSCYTEKQYTCRIYSTHFLEKSKPAIYYLGINGVRYLKPLTYTNKQDIPQPAYPLIELHKRYREHERSKAFRSRSITLADSCIALQASTTQNLRYGIATQADLANPYHGYHFLMEAEGIVPNLCILKHEYAQGEDITGPGTITNYLLEIFDPTTPRYIIRYRIGKYIDYIKDDEWNSDDNDPSPPHYPARTTHRY